MTLDVDPDRAAKAARALRDGSVDVQREELGIYRVTSFSRDRIYNVHLNGSRSCTCPDTQYRGTEACKHLLAVVLSEALK